MDSIHGSFRTPLDRQSAVAAELRAKDLLSDEELKRILQQGPLNETPVPRQVFVNRNLHMGKVELIGFDMDYTLAIYHLRRLEQLSYDLTVERLIANCGYTEEIRKVPYDHSFVLRGVFVDKVRGNLLKIDRFGYVGRAFHGRQNLPDEEIQRLYRNERIRMKSTDYAWIDTLFALPEACLLAGIIELYETRLHLPLDYRKLYDDIREAIDTVHRDNSLKKIIRADISRYIFKDEELGPALHKLRSGGKKLFVLTNSLWDYTNAVMSYLLDGVLPEYPSWRNYFDFIVTGGSKPGFFSEQRPFLMIDPASEDNKVLGEAEGIERGKIYQGGNLADFERFTGYAGESVLYVGDHIYGDILRSKKDLGWRTMLVISELEQEIENLRRNADDNRRYEDLLHIKDQLDDELQRLTLTIAQMTGAAPAPLGTAAKARAANKGPAGLAALEKRLKDVSERRSQTREALRKNLAEYHAKFHPVWGELMKTGHQNARFAAQVENYACLYTSKFTNLRYYSPNKSFRSTRDYMPHDEVVL